MDLSEIKYKISLENISNTIIQKIKLQSIKVLYFKGKTGEYKNFNMDNNSNCINQLIMRGTDINLNLCVFTDNKDIYNDMATGMHDVSIKIEIYTAICKYVETIKFDGIGKTSNIEYKIIEDSEDITNA